MLKGSIISSTKKIKNGIMNNQDLGAQVLWSQNIFLAEKEL
jgi:hypothetical protein